MTVRLVLVVALLSSAVARASDQVEKAEQLVAKMEYKRALRVVGRILASPKSQPEDLASAFRLQGMCMIGLGKNDKAIESFRKLLAIQPTYRIPQEASPNTKAPFYKALSMGGMKPIALSHQVPKGPRRVAGARLFVRLESNPFGMIRFVRLRYKTGRSKTWRRVKVKRKRPGRVACRLPRKLRTDHVQYFFEAVNKRGGVLGRAGSAEQPFELGSKAAVKVVTIASTEPEKVVTTASIEPEKTEEQPQTGADPVTDFETVEEKIPVAVAKTSTGEAEASRNTVESTPIVPTEQSGEQTGQVPAEDQDGDAWYTTWWFWTAVGVVTAGAVTGVVLAATADGSDNPSAYGVHLDW